MRHAQSKALLAYWRARRFGGAAPQRADIEPQDISELLGNIFILKRIDPGHHTFRLAGTNMCAIYQREFRDQNFLSLFLGHDKTHIQALLESVLGGVSPASITARATSLDMNQLPVEISFLPLRGPEGQVDRILGLYQPLDDAINFKNRPVIRTSLREIRPPAVPGHLFTMKPDWAEIFDQSIANDR